MYQKSLTNKCKVKIMIHQPPILTSKSVLFMTKSDARKNDHNVNIVATKKDQCEEGNKLLPPLLTLKDRYYDEIFAFLQVICYKN